MWWVPLAAAVGLGLFVVVLHVWHHRRQLDDAKSYRARFIQLVAQLETVTSAVNDLGTRVRQVKDAKVLDYYESTLRILGTLLAAVRRIPPFGDEPGTLDSAFFLVRDCRHRVGRTYQAFQDTLRGKEVKLDQLYGATAKRKAWPTGCYFCSRPMIAARFANVRVRIDGVTKEVASCKVCKDELESTKKVKVLYFLKDGKPIHWAEVSDYLPSEDFWNINKRDIVRKSTRLELVTTETKPSDP